MSKRTKPQQREIYTAQVLRKKQVSPNFTRITAGGAGLAELPYMGNDHWFRMFMRRPGQTELKLPSVTSNLWYAQYLLMAKESRPTVRNYTIREYRAEGVDGPEIDIDFVIHDGGTPASDWAAEAESGETFGLLDEGLIYDPTVESAWKLLVGDESALPAIAGVLDAAPADLRAEVFIELPHADDAQELRALDGVNVHWVPRRDAHDRPGPAVMDAVKAATLPDGHDGYAYLAGESALATGLRRFLTGERGFAKSHVSFTGYWRFGKAAA